MPDLFPAPPEVGDQIGERPEGRSGLFLVDRVHLVITETEGVAQAAEFVDGLRQQGLEDFVAGRDGCSLSLTISSTPTIRDRKPRFRRLAIP
jgi:hypothetical protein